MLAWLDRGLELSVELSFGGVGSGLWVCLGLMGLGFRVYGLRVQGVACSIPSANE